MSFYDDIEKTINTTLKNYEKEIGKVTKPKTISKGKDYIVGKDNKEDELEI